MIAWSLQRTNQMFSWAKHILENLEQERDQLYDLEAEFPDQKALISILWASVNKTDGIRAELCKILDEQIALNDKQIIDAATTVDTYKTNCSTEKLALIDSLDWDLSGNEDKFYLTLVNTGNMPSLSLMVTLENDGYRSEVVTKPGEAEQHISEVKNLFDS